MTEKLNYEKDITIDESALDVEWLEQPQLMIKYAQEEARAQREYEEAKEHLDVIEAELYEKICNDPDTYNLPKTTEGAIAGAIKMTDKYQKAQKQVHLAQYEYNMAKAAVRALYGKKEALENLVRLYGQQYFAGPQAPRNLSKEWEKKARQAESNRKVGSNMKRGK